MTLPLNTLLSANVGSRPLSQLYPSLYLEQLASHIKLPVYNSVTAIVYVYPVIETRTSDLGMYFFL